MSEQLRSTPKIAPTSCSVNIFSLAAFLHTNYCRLDKVVCATLTLFPLVSLLHKLGTGSNLVHTSNFEQFGAYWRHIHFFGMPKVGFQLEPKNIRFSWTLSANREDISGRLQVGQVFPGSGWACRWSAWSVHVAYNYKLTLKKLLS